MRKTLVMGLMAMFASAPAWAQQPRIGFIDREAIVQTERVQAFIQQMESQVKARQEEYNLLEEKYLAAKDDFQTKSEFMEPEQKKEAEDQLQKQLRETLTKRKELAEELDKQQDEKLKDILDEVKGIAEHVALRKGYQIILWKHALAYGAPENDLTQDVLDEFTQKKEE